MINVLFIGRSNPIFIDFIGGFSRFMESHDVNIIYLSDKEQTCKHRNLEIINVHDIKQKKSLQELQAKYSFSIFKTLVPERSFFDYSSFRKNQCYSRLNLRQVEEKVTPYANALDYLIRERVDILIDGLADNFMTAMATRIAKHYGKPFKMQFVYYWWSDGMLMADREDQTSSVIDRYYMHYSTHPQEVDRARLERIFYGPKIKLSYSGESGGKYRLSLRLKQLRNRMNSYEPLSFRNWLIRRVSLYASAFLIKQLIPVKKECPTGEVFVFFPLHVSPEASLLGCNPELADQFSLIKNISMNLPWGVKLYVKDHPHQLVGAGLNYDFYRRLTSLPNVVCIDKDISFKEVVGRKECLAVAVISGTVGLEAALMRKPVFIFGNPIYKAASCFFKPGNFEDFYRMLSDVMKGSFKFEEAALYAILQAIDDSVIRGQLIFSENATWEEASYASFPILERCILEGDWNPSAN